MEDLDFESMDRQKASGLIIIGLLLTVVAEVLNMEVGIEKTTDIMEKIRIHLEQRFKDVSEDVKMEKIKAEGAIKN